MEVKKKSMPSKKKRAVVESSSDEEEEEEYDEPQAEPVKKVANDIRVIFVYHANIGERIEPQLRHVAGYLRRTGFAHIEEERYSLISNFSNYSGNVLIVENQPQIDGQTRETIALNKRVRMVVYKNRPHVKILWIQNKNAPGLSESDKKLLYDSNIWFVNLEKITEENPEYMKWLTARFQSLVNEFHTRKSDDYVSMPVNKSQKQPPPRHKHHDDDAFVAGHGGMKCADEYCCGTMKMITYGDDGDGTLKSSHKGLCIFVDDVHLWEPCSVGMTGLCLYLRMKGHHVYQNSLSQMPSDVKKIDLYIENHNVNELDYLHVDPINEGKHVILFGSGQPMPRTSNTKAHPVHVTWSTLENSLLPRNEREMQNLETTLADIAKNAKQ